MTSPEAKAKTNPNRLTDVANAEVLKSHYGDRIRHKNGLDWLAWDGKRWKPDKKQVRYLAQSLGTLIRQDGARYKEPEKAKKILQHANRAESSGGINAALKEASVLPGIRAESIDFDSHPHLLNVENGTLDLLTGTLREHRPEDHLTKLAPIGYDPSAKCPRWCQFMEEIFQDDREIIDYMQWVAGYSLTGLTIHHIFFLLYGQGRNGKSTWMNILAEILSSDYAQRLNQELLLKQRHAQHSTGLAALRGIRLVNAMEVNEGRQLNEALIKGITGGDSMRARFMCKDEFEFRPECKLFIGTNCRPIISDSSKGMWARVRLIPFEASFPQDSPGHDPNLTAKLLAEREGILAWAVEGARRGLDREPHVPEKVRAATNAYHWEQDTISRFLDEECERVPLTKVTKKVLLERYKAYAGEEIGPKDFTDRIRGLGIEETRIHGGERGWNGIRLKPAPTS